MLGFIKSASLVSLTLKLLQALAARSDNGIDDVVVKMVKAMFVRDWVTVGRLVPELVEAVDEELAKRQK